MPKIVLVTADCLRQDAVYQPFCETPHIDSVAREGVMFDQAYAQANNSLSSHCAMLASTYVRHTGVYTSESRRRPSVHDPLACLSRAGIKTFSATSVDFLRDATSEWFLNREEFGGRRLGHDTTRQARTVLQAIAHQDFFLWVHYRDCHMGYHAPPEFQSLYEGDRAVVQIQNYSLAEEMEHLESSCYRPSYFKLDGGLSARAFRLWPQRYLASVSYVDAQIGLLQRLLDDLQIYDETMLIVTGSHGENLIENRVFCDHLKLFDATVRVPLIVKFPGSRFGGACCDVLVQHLDLLPTVAYEADVELERAQGEALQPLLEGARSAAGRLSICEHTCNFQRSVRTRDWQLITTVDPEARTCPAHRYVRPLSYEPEVLMRREGPLFTSEKDANLIDELPQVREHLLFLLGSQLAATPEVRRAARAVGAVDRVSREGG